MDGNKLSKDDVETYYPASTGLTYEFEGVKVTVKRTPDKQFYIIPEGESNFNVHIPGKHCIFFTE